ncbi:MAG: hypothetical protein AAFN13_11750 [Bacteroidota bacterium]
MSIRYLLALLTLGLLAAAPTTAQRTVDYPALGLQFDVPSGWQGQEGDGVYLLQSAQVQGLVALLPHEATTMGELEASAREGLDLGDGTALQPNGTVDSFGASAFGSPGVRVDLAGMVEWNAAEAHALALLSPHGGGVVVVAVAPHGQFSDTYRGYAEAVAHSVVFDAPETPPVVDEWRAALTGMQLAQFDTRTGYDGGTSSRRTLTLCNGYFYYASSYSGYGVNFDGSGASTAGNRSDGGTWTVSADAAGTPMLDLVYGDGTEVSYVLSTEDGKTFLDGERVLRTNGSCE